MPATKFAIIGPMYGELMYRQAYKPIFLALSWKKKISLRNARAMVCADVMKIAVKIRRTKNVAKSFAKAVAMVKKSPKSSVQNRTGARPQ